ncbi:MAG: abortive infection family protein [Candidatus Omnitrophica bacterium]|jgi:hypothetical protein|nr:abortive infection family protein [Candidatus Omnitrophota bacterium]
MIRLYQGSGSGEVSFVAEVDDSKWIKCKADAIKLLRARNKRKAADVLAKIPFVLNEGTNVFGDEFSYLSAICDLDLYVKLAKEERTSKAHKYAEIANTITEIGPYIRFIVVELNVNEEEEKMVARPHLTATAEIVKEALADSEQLLRTRPLPSAVDRLHTAFHGYLLEQCRKNNIAHSSEDSITVLFKQLRQLHPRLKGEAIEHEEIDRICKALAIIIDSLNPIRNQHSRAHPNEDIIGDDESLLVINSIRSLFHYLNAKL